MGYNSANKNNSDKTYFAARSPEDCVSVLMEKVEYCSVTLEGIGYTYKLRDMYAAYHGAYYDSISNAHKITFGGDTDELVELAVNQFRNIADHMLTMTTSTRPALDPRAVNTDQKSVVQTQLASGLLDYYMRDRKYGLENKLKESCRHGIAQGSGYIKMAWNSLAGEVTNQEEIDEATELRSMGEDVDIPEREYQGDIEFSNVSSLDVTYDLTKEGFDHDWVIVRSHKNRYDLIAKYPEFAAEILKIEPKENADRIRFGSAYIQETDDIPVFEFYHRRSESMPDGRYMLYVSEKAVLHDGDLPYRKIPLFRLSPSLIMGTPLGYSPMFDLLPIQEGINTLYSTALTNQATFGVQNILNPTGSDIDVNQLGGGLNVIDYNPMGGGKPEALNLTNTPPEIFNFMQMLEKQMETISGINAVIRGNPEANLRSGVSLAMVQSNAIQFMSGIQSSYVHLLEDVGLGIIEMLIDFADSPRVADIVGDSNKSYIREFQGSDLSSITRVIVDVANPMTKTIAGKTQIADNLLQYGSITPDQYYSVLSTGNLKTATESIDHQQNLMKDENEMLMRGESGVVVSPLDLHSKHILEHRTVMDDPELRQNPEKLEAVMAHITEHYKTLEELSVSNPQLLVMIGETPLQPTQPPAPEAGGQPPQEGDVPPGIAPQSMSPVDQAMQDQGGVPQEPKMPEGFEDAPMTPEQNLERIM